MTFRAAQDQDGTVLDILVRSRRNATAAKRLLAKPMKKQCRVLRVLVTYRLRTYGLAHRELMPLVGHRQSKYLNNRAENSRQPTRQRERPMKGFLLRHRNTAVPVRVRRDLTALQAPTPPPHRPSVPRRDAPPLRDLEPDHR
ncbi:DDE-type integrase/transposase/recombinase [Streptomyces hirsutus]